jgi:hypothetical protein
MPLTEVKFQPDDDPLPGDVRSFLREAERRIDEFQRHACIPGFVPSDFARVYQALRSLPTSQMTRGQLFCEWGSGFGVVTCLAAMLDFDAVGIEINEGLVDEAQTLADDFGVPVEFVRGSFIPKGGDAYASVKAGHAWLITEETGANVQMGLDPDDFNIIFAYPWPDEEGATEKLFERYAAPGALLMTYHGGDEIRLRRKNGKKARR